MGFFYSQLFVRPSYPTTSFAGQTIIVTGANVGLGMEAARHFVRLDAAKVILAVRNTDSGDEAKRSIESTTKRTGVVEVWRLDLASYASVKSFADSAAKLPRLDAVVENAGIATANYSRAEADERTITVNVVSTFLLALLLLPALKATAKTHRTTPCLTIVSSEVHTWVSLPERDSDNLFDTLSEEKTANMKDRYPTSKLLEVLFVRALAPKIKDSGVALNILNPGLCHSSLSRDSGFGLEVMKFFLARSTEVGSRTLVAAAAAGAKSHGRYMDDGLVHDEGVSEFARSEDGKKAQDKVWKEMTAKLEGISPGIMKNV